VRYFVTLLTLSINCSSLRLRLAGALIMRPTSGASMVRRSLYLFLAHPLSSRVSNQRKSLIRERWSVDGSAERSFEHLVLLREFALSCARSSENPLHTLKLAAFGF